MPDPINPNVLNKIAFLVYLLLTVSLEQYWGQTPLVYESEHLKIEKLATHTYRHISYLNTNDFGRVACNGMVLVDEGEAIVFDTPVDDTAAVEFINWVKNSLSGNILAVIPTHFHYDCLGSLEVFHQYGIPSYANNTTIELARSSKLPVPQNGFDRLLILDLGRHSVKVEHPGPGHTIDNVIAYYSNDQSLFGGCLIKRIGAGEGNLEDADTDQWPATIDVIQEEYAEANIIIPGHGPPGGQDLLTYTKELFLRKNKP